MPLPTHSISDPLPPMLVNRSAINTSSGSAGYDGDGGYSGNGSGHMSRQHRSRNGNRGRLQLHRKKKLNQTLQVLSIVVTVLMIITAVAVLIYTIVPLMWRQTSPSSMLLQRELDRPPSATVAADEISSNDKDPQQLIPMYCPYPNITVKRKSKRTAFLLSLFVGGLGIDRFYLSHIVTGLVKLFTIGGLGVWWIIDWVLILNDVLIDISGCPLMMDM